MRHSTKRDTDQWQNEAISFFFSDNERNPDQLGLLLLLLLLPTHVQRNQQQNVKSSVNQTSVSQSWFRAEKGKLTLYRISTVLVLLAPCCSTEVQGGGGLK